MYLPNIYLSKYAYNLPAEKIAKYPAERRDNSRLLSFIHGNISESPFLQLPDMLPQDSTLVFNNSKVIKARLLFPKPTGGRVEILCLNPVAPATFDEALSATHLCVWECVIGNTKKWKTDSIEKNFQYNDQTYIIKARKVDSDNNSTIAFVWDAPIDFSTVLNCCGCIPLPPYIRRESKMSDEETYQTVFSKHEGSVAAPTAGLHFSNEILTQIAERGIVREEVTLHVSAGTFLPITEQYVYKHKMHQETFMIDRSTLERLHSQLGNIIAVGTTSARVLESLYWLGAMANTRIFPVLRQWDAYKYTQYMPAREAFERLMTVMDRTGVTTLTSTTEIMIVPGYKFKTIKGLVTNFHQPHSTLLLLIAALIGNRWRDVYNYALDNNFRFLSYGDCSLLLP
jgi:S-adenosylmethionine:tRNA ribosyltransferase-isomerase